MFSQKKKSHAVNCSILLCSLTQPNCYYFLNFL